MQAAPIFLPMLLIVVFSACVVASLFIPNYAGSRREPAYHCINNLRQIDAAKQEWAFQTKAPSNAAPTWDNIRPYLGRGTAGSSPECPQGGKYTIHDLQSAPTCSIPGHILE